MQMTPPNINPATDINCSCGSSHMKPISPTTPVVTISGTTTIQTIAVPANFPFGCIDILASGAWSKNTSGNVANTVAAASGTMYRACYMSDSKWHIK